MTGFLVVNHYLKGEKFDILHKHLIKSAKNFGIELITITNQEVLFDEGTPDFVLFWDKDINCALALEKRGIPVFNRARAIELCDDKAKTYLALKGIVPQPKTIPAPLSFYDVDYGEFVNAASDVLGMPIVFKECFGSFGEQVFLCNSKDEILRHINGKPFILQKYIETGGEDVRLEFVGGECVAAMKRSNKNDFRSNITNGGIAEKYTPSDEEVALGKRACEVLKLDFGGVDIIGHNMVCEVNSNAHIINLMNTTGIDIAPMIFEYIRSKI